MMERGRLGAKVLVIIALLVLGMSVAGCFAPADTPTPYIIVVTATPGQPTATVVATATPEPSPTETNTSAPATPTAMPTSEPSVTPVPTETLQPNVAKVTAALLNVRQGPSTSYAVTRVLDLGSTLTVVGQSADAEWLQVRLSDGSLGWVSRRYTDFKGTAPVVSTPGPTVTATPTPLPSAEAWRGEYFSNRSLSGAPVLVRDDASIDYNWGSGSPAAQVPSDGFSVRWTRAVWFGGGRHRFHATVDDGMRVYVDGILLINEWRDGGQREVSVEYDLSTGEHVIRVEYYENAGDARVKLWWERIGTFANWQGKYYSNPLLSGVPVMVRDDVSVDFNWAGSAPVANMPADNFSVQWSRTLTFEGGTYRFHLIIDDGARLWIDGQQLINEWRDGSWREATAEREMSAGNHSLQVDYYERGGQAAVRLWWEKVADEESFPDWMGRYWANPSLDGWPVAIRNDKEINFDWGLGSPHVTVPTENFSARWTRVARFEDSTYRFHVVVNDGARLWIDGALKIDEWSEGDTREITLDIPVKKGQHELQVEYRALRGEAVIKVWWEKYPPATYPDWMGQYWDNPNLEGEPALVRNDEALVFDWREGSPAYRIPADRFSARWTRQVTFSTGRYRFYIHADDGVRFYVDNKVKLDQWHEWRGDSVYTLDLELQGSHALKLEYYEQTGGARVYIHWEKLADLATPTSAPTNTPTAMPTDTPTRTPTSTPSPTMTVEPTSAPTATPTQMATATPTPTATRTPAGTIVPRTVLLQEGADDYEGTADAWINEWDKDVNNGERGDLRVRQGGVKSTLMRFDLSDVFTSKDVLVHEATLVLYSTERTNENPMEISAYMVLSPWEELEVTWEDASEDVPWEDPGCSADELDLDADALATVEIDAVEEEVEIDVTDAVQAWAEDPASNYGVVLKGAGPVQVRYSFASSEYIKVSRRPVLRITYSGASILGRRTVIGATPRWRNNLAKPERTAGGGMIK